VADRPGQLIDLLAEPGDRLPLLKLRLPQRIERAGVCPRNSAR
jgi:hypothetical protein